MAERCRECVHRWHLDQDLRCRRYPPTVHLIDGVEQSKVPLVHPEFVCGEFKRKQTIRADDGKHEN